MVELIKCLILYDLNPDGVLSPLEGEAIKDIKGLVENEVLSWPMNLATNNEWTRYLWFDGNKEVQEILKIIPEGTVIVTLPVNLVLSKGRDGIEKLCEKYGLSHGYYERPMILDKNCGVPSALHKNP